MSVWSSLYTSKLSCAFNWVSSILSGWSGAVAANVDVYLDPDGSVVGPVGDPINLVASVDLSAPTELVQYQFDVSGAGVEVNSGDIYIVVNENGSGFRHR